MADKDEMGNSLASLFNPRSIAVVGASSNPRKQGYKYLELLLQFGFKGKIYPVNPQGGTILGLDVYSSVTAIPEAVDYVISTVRAESVPQEVVDETEGRIVSLLDAMGFDARVDVYDAGGYVAVDVAPDNTALFIGQKGETIDALQYLVTAGVNKSRGARTRVVIDAEGYRQRRIEALQGMAHRTARKVMREDRAVELPPMNPAERRVVHLYLRDNPGVTTESEGTGDSRRVRVSPS